MSMVGIMSPKIVPVEEAGARLRELISLAEQGEEVVIAKAGKPVARLVPFARPGERPLGMDAGKHFYIAPDFDGPLPPEIQKYFEE